MQSTFETEEFSIDHPLKELEDMREIQGSSILILGYGREGKSVHQYLLKNYPDIKVGIADLKGVKEPIDPATPVHAGEDYLASLQYYDTIVRSPGIPLRTAEIQQAIDTGKQVTSATNIFLAEQQGNVIGITGTKGKSTTSSLIFAILQTQYPDVRLVGNIGKSALDYLADADRNTIFVFELSSYQLADIRCSPHIAVFLNLVPEHLDYHGGFLDYAEAKENIFRYQTQNDFAVFNPAQLKVAEIAGRYPAQKICFSLEPIVRQTHKQAKEQIDRCQCYVKNGSIWADCKTRGNEQILSISEIPLLGKGNVENVLAAIAVGLHFEVPLPLIREAIKAFQPLKHRLELVGEYRGIRFYNDSIATIPAAAINAIEAFGNDVQTLIAGGLDRGVDFTEFGVFLVKKRIETLILFPTTGERIWHAVCRAAAGEEFCPRKYDVSTMEEAVRIAFETSLPGKVCLLSPASSSYSVFRSFEDRGDQFRQWVKQLGIV